jgi:aryl-alcohol dehydrogenase-like predicted oxidoreductase
MKYRTFGRSGLRVSEAFLGTMTFGEDWGWGASAEDCRKMVTAYAEAGGNVIDTANNYTDGASERIVGELVESDRDHFVLSTKYTLSLDGADPNASGNHRKSLTRSLDQSLHTDYIDILWVHIWDAHTPIEEMMRALDDAVRAGKVLYIGISERDLRVARSVDAVAGDLGVSSSEVAIAWTMAHRPWVHPILGARRLDQLTTNLAALDLRLPEESLRRLDEASAIELGFPHDFIESSREFVYGPVSRNVLGRTG